MTHALPPTKLSIQRAFAKAAESYDAHAFLQREMADRLFERLDYIKLQPKRILDLGSGTGYVTRMLRERYPDAHLLALDIAPDMHRVANRQWPEKSLLARLFGPSPVFYPVVADAEALPLTASCVDVVISNVMLPWCNPESVAREVLRVLVPQGLFIFTTLGPDTLKELRAAFRAVDNGAHVNDFIDMHDVGDILSHCGFADPVMDQEVLTLTYEALKPLLQDLKGVGAQHVTKGRNPGLMGRQSWKNLLAAYESFRQDGRLPATYEAVYGLAWKPAFSRRVDDRQVIELDDFKRMVHK
ncbi:MAG: malonyl-ACP O-methyltransferase BioC [Betaproteobacteria bacterium]|nr:malonyl-ACP O-methyltransferase BioC [Betaproteobacteria bacterium]